MKTQTTYEQAWEEIFAELPAATRELLKASPDGRASARMANAADDLAMGNVTLRMAVKMTLGTA